MLNSFFTSEKSLDLNSQKLLELAKDLKVFLDVEDPKQKSKQRQKRR